MLIVTTISLTPFRIVLSIAAKGSNLYFSSDKNRILIGHKKEAIIIFKIIGVVKSIQFDKYSKC